MKKRKKFLVFEVIGVILIVIAWLIIKSRFADGIKINLYMKQLSGTNGGSDRLITSIEKSESLDNLDLEKDKYYTFYTTNLSDKYYMWYDSGIIYWYTEDGTFELPKDSSWIFDSLQYLKSIDTEDMDTSKVTDMSYVFSNCISLENLDVSSLNTSKVKKMRGTFLSLNKLESLDLSSWDTSKVTDMSIMFEDNGFKELNITNFDTSKVINMSNMFTYGKSMKTIDLSSFDTSKVTNMTEMFFDNMGNETLTTIIVGSLWDTSKVILSTNMFTNCDTLVGGSGTKYDENNTDASYAHIDGGTSNPGYLTGK